MSTCEKDWIDIFTALLTPTIAAVGVGIAVFQLWLANTKLKLELFERRYVVYEAIRDFIGKTLSKGNSTEEMQQEFLVKTNSSKFLFGVEYSEFVTKVWGMVIDLETSCEILKNPSSEDERLEHVKKRGELKKSIVRLLGELEEKSLPFLKIREVI